MKRGREEALYVYNLLSSLSSSLISPFLPIFFFEIVGKNFFLLELVNMTPLIVTTTLSLVWAFLADRIGLYKPFILASLILSSATTFLLSLVNNFTDLFIVKLIGSVVGSMSSATFPALLAKIFRDHRERKISTYMTLGLIGGFSGSLVSGYLYEVYGVRNILKFLALASLVPAAVIAFIKEEKEKQSSLRNLMFNCFLTKIARIFTAKCLLVFPSAFSGGLIGVYFLEYLKGSPSLWALVSAVTTLANLSTILYGRLGERIGDVNLLFLAGLGWSVLYTVYGLTTDITIFALFFTIPVWPAFAIGYQTLLMKLSDEGSRASIYSIDNILSTIYSASIGILGGYLAEIFTPRPLFILAGFAVFLSAFIVKFYLLKNISS